MTKKSTPAISPTCFTSPIPRPARLRAKIPAPILYILTRNRAMALAAKIARMRAEKRSHAPKNATSSRGSPIGRLLATLAPAKAGVPSNVRSRRARQNFRPHLRLPELRRLPSVGRQGAVAAAIGAAHASPPPKLRSSPAHTADENDARIFPASRCNAHIPSYVISDSAAPLRKCAHLPFGSHR